MQAEALRPMITLKNSRNPTDDLIWSLAKPPAMQILNNLLAAIFGGGEATPETTVPGEFQFMLDELPLEGAPPGPPPESPPPPGEKVAGEGVAIQWPNAEIQRLDFLPQTSETAVVTMAPDSEEQPLAETEGEEEGPVATEPNMAPFAVPVLPLAVATVAQPIAAAPVQPEQRVAPQSPEPIQAITAPKEEKASPATTVRPEHTSRPPKVKHTHVELPQEHKQEQAATKITTEATQKTAEPILPAAPANHTISKANPERLATDRAVPQPRATTAQPASPEANQVSQALTELKATHVVVTTPDAAKSTQVVVTNPDAVKATQVVVTSPELAKPSNEAPDVVKATPKPEIVEPHSKTAKPEQPAAQVKPEQILLDKAATKTAVIKDAPETEPVDEPAKPSEPIAQPKAANHQGSKDEKPSTDNDALELLEKKPAKETTKDSQLIHAEVAKRVETTTEIKPAREVTQTDLKAVIKQVSDRIEILAARPREAVTIHLRPQDLGTITLTVKAVGNLIDTQIAASDQGVRKALEQNHSHLAASLEQRGYTVNQISVSNSSSLNTEAQARHQQQNQQQQQPNQQARHATTHQFGTNVPTDPAQVRQFVRKASGVDLWI